MKHLHYRLSLGMLGIIVMLGVAFYAVDRYSVRAYYEELSQRLNASLAMYVVNAGPLIDAGGVDDEALAELANRAMIINPTAEIYLLDLEGRILGHALPPEDVLADRVDVAPIRDLLAESATLPIKGTDPRNPGSRKIFSAFPVNDAGDAERHAGFLYVVLGGANYEAVAEQVSGSDRQRMLATTFALLISASERPQDEIDQLRNACHYMANTIQQQVASLQENDRLRRELVTNISHDLRTPLTTMQGYIETLMMKDDVLDARTRRQYLEIARRHSAHLGRLIQDLFELARLDSSRVTPEFEQFSLTELIHDIVQEFELQAREARVSLRVEPPAQPVSVVADISLIQRVLENLVGNALKYTPEGGKVSISMQPSTDGVGVSVADTGPGIREEDLPHIFERFYKAEPDTEAGARSMGLGLAIAKRILELHGGDIIVTSEEPRGTRFRFDLPQNIRAA